MARLDKPLRIFGVLDAAWTPEHVDATETTATEADPRPGRATSTDELARLDVGFTGAQADDATLTVVRSGFPSLGRQELGIAYRLPGEVEADLRGHLAPSALTDFHAVDDSTASGWGGDDLCDAAFCELSGHVVFLAGTDPTETLRRLDPVTGLTELLADPGVDLGGDTRAIAYVYGTARLVCAGRGGVYYSDDHGDTWAPVETEGRIGSALSAGTWAAPSSTGFSKYRLVSDREGNLLWLGKETGGAAYVLKGAASADEGATWDAVSSLADATGDGAYDAATHPDGYIGVLIDTVDGLHFARLGSAFDPIEDAELVLITAPAGRLDNVTLAADSDGKWWAWGSDALGGQTCHYSRDHGVTWRASDPWYQRISTDFRAVPHPHGGLVASWADRGVVRFGGWSGPSRGGAAWADDTAPRDDSSWTAFVVPTSGAEENYAVSGSGSYAVVTGSGTAPYGYLRTTSGASAYDLIFSRDVYSDDRKQASAEWAWRVPDDGGTTAAAIASGIGLELRTRHAADNQLRRVTVYADEAGYRVRDEEGAAWLTSKVAVDLTGRVFMRISFDHTGGWIAHRAEVDSATAWVVTTFAAPSTSATAASGVRVRWAHLASGVTNATAHWWFVKARGTTSELLEGLDVAGLGAQRYPVPELYDAARGRVAWLRVRGGPAVIGETYEVAADHGYPIDAVFPTASPSPSAPWRSTTTASAQEIAVDTGADGLVADGQGVITFAVRRANVRRVKLRGRPDGGAWAVIGTIDLAEGFADLTADRDGRVLAPATGTAAGARYLRRGELRGGWAHLDPGGAQECYRRIRDNTAGWWGDGGGPTARVHLEEIDGTEPTTGFTVHLVWHSGVLVIEDATTYRHLSVRVDANEDTPDAYYEIGGVFVGGAVALGKQWSGSSEHGYAPNVATDTDRAGTARRAQLGPTRRTATLQWDEGVHEARFVGASQATADYLSTVGGYAATARDDVRGQLLGALEAAEGGARPVLVLFGDHADPGATITDPTVWLVGYLDGEIRYSTDGRYDPGTGEFARIGSVLVIEAV